MSGISNDVSKTNRDAASAAQQATQGLVNNPAPGSQDDAVEEDTDATVVELSSSASSSVNAGNVSADAPEDADSASSLADELAAQITGAGSDAEAAHAAITPAMALKLTQS